MIARWPNPRPDELLYSVIARCALLLRIHFHRTLAQSLFGLRMARAVVRLPYHLGHVAAQIPGKHRDDPRRIAQELTLLPLYLPFVRRELGSKLVAAMLGRCPEAGRVPNVDPRGSGLSQVLRFCPSCWKEQKREFGERYWSRAHQAPGYMVCHRHQKPLWESSVPSSYNPTLQIFTSASAVKLCDCRPIRATVSPVLLSLAGSIHWLLNENIYAPGTELLRPAYEEALRELSLTQGPFLRMREVKALVIKSSGAMVLTDLDSGLGEGETDWLAQMLHPSRTGCSSQPAFRHLLLMHAIGHTAESFFGAMQKPSLLEQTLKATTFHEVPAAISTHDESVRIWWSDQSISVNEMGRRLGVNPQKVELIALKAGLPSPRFGKWGNAMKVEGQDLDEIRQRSRETFLSLRKANPEAGIKALAKVDQRVVTWLRRHDWIWLQDHRPARLNLGGAPALDWAARDASLVRQIPAAVKRLRERSSPISVSALERELRCRISNIRRRLPQTDLLLKKVVTRQPRDF